VLATAIAEIALEDDEQIVRADMVEVHTRSLWALLDESQGMRLASMAITNRRVLFARPNVRRALAFELCWKTYARLRIPGERMRPRPRLSTPITIGLQSIVKIWTWRPEFSGSVRLQMARDERRDFELMQPVYPWEEPTTIEDKRQHADDLLTVWDAARNTPAVWSARGEISRDAASGAG
jgi:hypothetical protein